MSAEKTEQPQLTLESRDGVQISVPKDVVERSSLIKHAVDDLGEEAMTEPIPLPNVDAAVLKKVVEWCTHHRDDPPVRADENSASEETADMDEWDQKFMQVDQDMLLEIILAANYLDVKQLLHIGCKTVANMIKGKPSGEIRQIFNIENDFTQKEADQILREHEWDEE